MRSLLIFVFIVFTQLANFAQLPSISPQQAQKELAKRGITEQEVKDRMKQKGFDLDNIDPKKPQEVAKIQKELEKTIAELEAEKRSERGGVNSENTAQKIEQSEKRVQEEEEQAAKEATTNIREAVEQGESLGNALAEEFAESVQVDLPPAQIWGQHLFREKSLKLFTRSEDATPPDTYVLGAGDQINISIWGMSQADFNLEIEKDGYIYPSSLPRIYLKSLNFKQARSLLQSRFSNYYRFRPEEFQTSIRFVRTITVNIWGEANIYGSFNIPATNTAFNALVAAGGPSDIGSVRNIELKRSTESKKIDIYEFMNDPTIQYDLFLQNNDIIYIPVAERLVRISGYVKRPFIYELTDGENLKQLIEFAGGLAVNAYQKEIQIKRIINDEESIIDVPMRTLFEANQDFTLLNGDVVTIKSIPKPYENFVEIVGAIELPGRYALESGMRVSDLIAKGVLNRQARRDFAYIYHQNEDNTSSIGRINLEAILQDNSIVDNALLGPGDRIITFKQSNFADSIYVNIKGAVREPASFPYDHSESLTVEDLIFLAGGLQPNATDFAYIKRRDVDNSEKIEYVSINLSDLLANPLDKNKNPILRPFDEIIISQKETYTEDFMVTVGGAVRNPGEFIYGESLTLKDLLILAGGLKFGASSNRIDIYRLRLSENQPTQTIVAQIAVDENLNPMASGEFKIEPLDKIYVRKVPNFETQQFVVIEGEVTYPGAYALLSDNERILNLIERAGGLTVEAFPEGAYMVRINDQPGQTIINLEKLENNSNSKFNFILKRGDTITIPKAKELVTINLKNTLALDLYPDKFVEGGGLINVGYHQGKRAAWYINEYAAGIDRNKRAKKKLITIEHPNKRLDKYKGWLSTPKVSKGSIISVGTKPQKQKKKEKEKKETDWDKVLTQVLAVGSTIATMITAIAILNRSQ